MKETGDIILLEKILLLRKVSMFSDTPEHYLEDLASEMLEEAHLAGEVLFREGDPGETLYLVYSGEVEVSKKGHLIATFGRNEFFGELSVLDTDIRSATATCKTDCVLLALHQEALYDIMELQPQIIRSILHELCRRVRSTDEQLFGKDQDL